MPGGSRGGGGGRGGGEGGGGGRGGKKKFGHKGGMRHFTNEEDIIRQSNEIRKQRERGESSSDADDSSSEDSDEEKPVKGMHGLIKVENPNRVQTKHKKVKDLDFSTETGTAAASGGAPEALNRKEREVLEAERKKAEYQKRHARGETEEAQRDLARLAIIRKQREEDAKKAEEEKKAKEAAKSK